jgi:type I restriction enzyme S subunit
MECGGNDAALAGHALDSAPADPPGPEAAEHGWQQQTLGQMVDAGIVWAKNGYADGGHNESGIGIPHLRPFNVSDNGDISLSQIKSVEPPPPESPHRLRRLDVIFNNTNSEELVGKTALFDSEGAFVLSNHMTILRVLRGQELDPAWLARALHLKWLCGESQAMCRRHMNQASISLDRLRSVELLLPSLPEQRAIASVLRTVQGTKEACEQVLAATRQLKQSLLHHLFTYGPVPFPQAAHVLLKETEVGPMPEHWGTIRLGDTASIGNGSTPKRTEPKYWDGGAIPWLTSAKVHDRTIRQADEFVTETAREECHLPMVSRGSLVIAITGQGKTLGNAAKLELAACVSQHLAYMTIHDTRLFPEFVLAFLRLRYDDLQAISRGGGSTKGALTCGFLKSFEVPLPLLPEQREIAAQLAAVDAKLAAEESRRAALAVLFQSLLHHLMTGQVRRPEFPGGQEVNLASPEALPQDNVQPKQA